MKRRPRNYDADEGALRRTTVTGKHAHVAEIHGEGVTLGLRPWAQRAVLAGVARS